jgi:hypothetical protein
VNGGVLVAVAGPWADIGRGAGAATAPGTALATVLAWRVVAQGSTVEAGGADTRVEEGSRDVRALVRAGTRSAWFVEFAASTRV